MLGRIGVGRRRAFCSAVPKAEVTDTAGGFHRAWLARAVDIARLEKIEAE